MKNIAPYVERLKYIIAFPLATIAIYESLVKNNNLYLYLITTYLLLLAGIAFFSVKHEEAKNNYKLYSISKQLKLKDEELDALNNLSQIVTSSLGIRDVIQLIYQIFNKFTGCDRWVISFINKDTNALVCAYEFGETILGEEGMSLTPDSATTQCFNNKQTIIQTDTFIKTRGIYGDKIAIPLNLSDEIVGAIFIESGNPNTFKNVNIVFLESLANYAAIAVKNAELFNSIYAQKQEIMALYEEAAAANDKLNTYVDELDKAKDELQQKNNELVKYYGEIQTGYFQTVMALANSIEAKDAYTRGHCQRVMEISSEIAKRMGYCDTQIQDLKYASILHDIGKIGIASAILRKQGSLTEGEYEEIKRHPLISYNILKDIEFISNALNAILQHHERYDGKGYPHGIQGTEICEFARILCVADAFDAMTSDRPYRKAMPIEEAIREINLGKGKQFDPKVAEVLIEMNEELNLHTI